MTVLDRDIMRCVKNLADNNNAVMEHFRQILYQFYEQNIYVLERLLNHYC